MTLYLHLTASLSPLQHSLRVEAVAVVVSPVLGCTCPDANALSFDASSRISDILPEQ